LLYTKIPDIGWEQFPLIKEMKKRTLQNLKGFECVEARVRAGKTLTYDEKKWLQNILDGYGPILVADFNLDVTMKNIYDQ